MRDHDFFWWIFDLGCAYGSTTCRPDTYAAVGVSVPKCQEAPTWAPDLSTIGADGLFFDEAKAPRWRTLDGWYLQGDTLYRVTQRRRVPGVTR